RVEPARGGIVGGGNPDRAAANDDHVKGGAGRRRRSELSRLPLRCRIAGQVIYPPFETIALPSLRHLLSAAPDSAYLCSLRPVHVVICYISLGRCPRAVA